MGERPWLVEHRYLNLPMRNGAEQRVLRFMADGVEVRRFGIELATGGGPDFWVYTDLTPFRGVQLTVEADEVDTGTLAALVQSDTPLGIDDLYRERYRSQFHFSSRRGYLDFEQRLSDRGQISRLRCDHFEL